MGIITFEMMMRAIERLRTEFEAYKIECNERFKKLEKPIEINAKKKEVKE